MHGNTGFYAKDIPMWAKVLLIAAACFIAYYPIIMAGFVSDDFLILYNIKCRSITDIGADKFFFRPLVILSFAVDSYFFKDRAVGYHLVNILMHLAASLGVAACAAMLLRRPNRDLVAGLIFALHPAHPEAVSWVAGRYDVLCGAFVAWSLYFYMKSRESDGRQNNRLKILSVVLFVLACLAKEMAFAFPLVLIAYELILPGKPRHSSEPLMMRLRHVAPFAVVAAILFSLRWLRLSGIGGYGEPEFIPFAGILYRIFLQPLKLLMFPLNRPLYDSSGSLLTVLTGMVLATPLILLFFARRQSIMAFSIAAIILSMLPTVHLGVLEWRMESSRFLYIPSIFFAFFIAALLFDVRKRGREKLVKYLVVVYLITLAVCLQQNNYPWIDAARLVQTASASTEQLVERYRGEWGVNKSELLVFNVPGVHLGAATLMNAIPSMLKLRYGDEMARVKYEVLYNGQTEESLEKIIQAKGKGSVVWFFDDNTWKFVEYDLN